MIVWIDYRYGTNNQDIIGQRYYTDGPNYGEKSPVVVANNTKIIFSWMDNRRSKGWDIYGKAVDWNWEGVTSVPEELNNLPKEFSLSQNYPNPFNPVTTISFTIPNVVDTKVSSNTNAVLKVFDILGQEVRTLLNEIKPAGNYQVQFDASNLPSGIYFYTLSYGEYLQTRKLVLLK